MTNKGSFERVPVDQVELDVGNPRIARVLAMYDDITPERMALALGVGDSQSGEENTTTFRSLRESIRTNKEIIHPIIVDKDPAGHMVVIEGNTRTLIYRQFLEQGLEGEWDTIPAMVYSNLSESQKDAIRLQAHLVGPRPWDPYSKAKYLAHLWKEEYSL